jgi:hypothetical protein
MDDLVIRITPDNRIYRETIGTTKTKVEISLEQLAETFLESMVPPQKREVELPSGTVRYIAREWNGVIKDETVAMEYETVNRPFKYYKTVFESIPFPKLIFLFTVKDKRIKQAKVGALTGLRLKENSIIYHYPYSNVHSSGQICFGNNTLPKIESLTELYKIPEIFLSSEMNNDLYSGANNSGMVLRELLELLDGTSFDCSILEPMCTYREFLSVSEENSY